MDVSALARDMIDRHGKDALLVVEQFVEADRQLGEREAAERWDEVAVAVQGFLAARKHP